MNTTDLVAFLNRKSRHQATLVSQATTSEVAFIHEDEAKRFAECATRLTALEAALKAAKEECDYARDVIHGGYHQYMTSDDLKGWAVSRNATDAKMKECGL